VDTIKRLSIIIILFGVGTIVGCSIVAKNASDKIKEKENLTPEEIVSSFYVKWKKEKDPFSEGFHTFKTDLTDEFNDSLIGYSGELNPVTCSESFPANFTVSPAIIKADKATVIWNNPASSLQARVKLISENNRWLINSVSCEEKES